MTTLQARSLRHGLVAAAALGFALVQQPTAGHAQGFLPSIARLRNAIVPHALVVRSVHRRTVRAAVVAGCEVTGATEAGELQLLSLLNQHRAAVGAPRLSLDAGLTRVAWQHSCDMFTHQQLTHRGSDGRDPFQRMAAAGITYQAAAENAGTADGFTLDAGIAAIDGEMMAEPLGQENHHTNIIDPAYSRIGIGIVFTRGQLWITEDFTG